MGPAGRAGVEGARHAREGRGAHPGRQGQLRQGRRRAPGVAGKTATFSQNAFYDGEIYVYPEGLGTDFLSYLGFTINPKLTPLAKNPGEQVAVSEERLDVIDADVIVFATEKESDIANLKKVRPSSS